MTPTPHGQVPEALIDLIDDYAETRHRCGGVYNAKTEAARKAVIEDLREALGGVQALSAAPEAFLKSVIALCSHRGYSPANIEAWDKDDKWIADLWRQAESMLAASPTPPAEQAVDPDGEAFRNAARLGLTLRFYGSCAQSSMPGTPSAYVVTQGSDRAEAMREAVEQAAAIIASGGEAPKAPLAPPAEQQAAPKAAPGEPIWWRKRADEIEAQVAMTGSPEAMRCYTDMRTLLQAAAEAAPQQEAQEPMAIKAMGYGGSTGINDYLMSDGTIKAMRPSEVVWAAPQPAPAPLSDEVLKEVIKDSNRYRWLRRPLLNAGQGSIQVVMDDRLNGKVDRVIFLAELDKAIDAALAAQGGKA